MLGDLSDLTRIDWGSNNLLAVALGASLYLWNGESADIEELFNSDSPETSDVERYVSGVSWLQGGNFLAVGNSQGEVGIFSSDHWNFNFTPGSGDFSLCEVVDFSRWSCFSCRCKFGTWKWNEKCALCGVTARESAVSTGMSTCWPADVAAVHCTTMTSVWRPMSSAPWTPHAQVCHFSCFRRTLSHSFYKYL